MLILTPDEVANLTGVKRRKSEQCQALKKMRIPYMEREDGSPIVARAVVEALLGVQAPIRGTPGPTLRIPKVLQRANHEASQNR